MLKIPAGRLRHRVTIEELIVELDSDGGQVEAWVPFGDGRPFPAEINPISARELVAAQAVHSKVTTRIRIRHRPGIQASMRVRHRDMVYEIEGIIPDPDSGRRFVTLLTTSFMSPLAPSAPAMPPAPPPAPAPSPPPAPSPSPVPPGPEEDSWQALIGFNTAPLADWDKSQPFVDLMATARPFRTYADPYNEEALAETKANGQPAEDFSVILLDNGVAADVGDYLCGFSGAGTPQLDATGGSIVDLATVGDVTTFTIRRNAFPIDGSDPRITLKVQGAAGDFGDDVPLYALRVGVPRGTGQIYGGAWEESLSPVAWKRFLNWGAVNGSTVATWAEIEARDTVPQQYGMRPSVMIDEANHTVKHSWFNLDALGDDTYRTNYVELIQADLDPELYGLVEWSNEPWGPQFLVFNQSLDAVKTATGARAGASAIVSVTKVAGVVTAVLAANHGLSPGAQISIVGVENIATGVFTTTAASAATLVWTSGSGDATGVVSGDSCIYLLPANEFCAPTSNLPVPSIWEARENYCVGQARDIHNKIATAGGSARLRSVVNIQLAGMDRYGRLLQWAVDKYGSASWATWAVPYYAEPEDQSSLTTEQAVKDALDAARLVVRERLRNFRVLMETYQCTHWAVYEMGPHNDVKTSGTQAAVAAVHRSDWMRLFAKTLYQDVCDILQCLAMWFQGGAVDTYGGTGNNTWAAAEPHITNSENSAKWKAAAEMAAMESYEPQSIDGLTWGTIDAADAIKWLPVANDSQNVILFAAQYLPESGWGFLVTPPSTGVKDIGIRFCANGTGERFDVLLDEEVVASSVAIPLQNPFADPAEVAWSGTYDFTTTAPRVLRIKPTVRLEALGFGGFDIT